MDNRYFTFGFDDMSQNPNSLLNDFWYFDYDSTSHASEPEHRITFCTSTSTTVLRYGNVEKQYENLAYAGLICQSTTEISTFSNFSAYFTRGMRVKRFIRSNQVEVDATNNFPEIAYDLLTNRRYGVGEFIGNNAVDPDRFNIAAEYCYKNGLYWDGVISENVNLRDFLYAQAAYQLLDFTIVGGVFSLYRRSRFVATTQSTMTPLRTQQTSRSKRCLLTATSATSNNFPFCRRTAAVYR